MLIDQSEPLLQTDWPIRAIATNWLTNQSYCYKLIDQSELLLQTDLINQSYCYKLIWPNWATLLITCIYIMSADIFLTFHQVSLVIKWLLSCLWIHLSYRLLLILLLNSKWNLLSLFQEFFLTLKKLDCYLSCSTKHFFNTILRTSCNHLVE